MLAPKKIYPIDQGLITAYTVKPNHEFAARLETCVFRYLRSQQTEIYYYHTRSNQQVDFLTVNFAGEMALYQSSLTLSDPETRSRELSALNQAMQELQLDRAIVITLDEEEQISTKEGTIECIPLLRLLLNPH